MASTLLATNLQSKILYDLPNLALQYRQAFSTLRTQALKNAGFGFGSFARGEGVGSDACLYLENEASHDPTRDSKPDSSFPFSTTPKFAKSLQAVGGA